MALSNSEYWEKRAETREQLNDQNIDDTIKELAKIYREANNRISTEVMAFFGRYATSKKMTLEEVIELIDLETLTNYREETIFYFDELEKHAYNPQYADYLKRQSARSYVTKLDELNQQINNELLLLTVNKERIVKSTLTDAYKTNYYRNIYDVSQYAGYGLNINKLDNKLVEKIIGQNWTHGNYSKSIWGDLERLNITLREKLGQAFAIGTSGHTIAEEMTKELSVSLYRAETIVRTEMTHISTQATHDSYVDTNVEKYMFLATLDTRTSEICQDLDGKIFNVADMEVGINAPPMHPNCRSTTICGDRPERLKERAARDTKGKSILVPASMSYKEWYSKFIDEAA